MNVLVYIENKIDDYALENLSLANKLITNKDGKIICISNTSENNKPLQKFNISKIYICEKQFEIPFIDINIIDEILKKENINIILTKKNINQNSLFDIISGYCNIPIYKNVKNISIDNHKFKIKQTILSNKGYLYKKIISDKIIIETTRGICNITYNEINSPQIENINLHKEKEDIILLKKEVSDSKLLLENAKIIISGGRGMQSPNNWYLLEELSKKINAGLACSKPISDNNWRPHNEHVGQTGKTISPDLYIAIGISGAIQHLGGILGSKKILVINKEVNIPFFKNADYFIVGDALEIIKKILTNLNNNL